MQLKIEQLAFKDVSTSRGMSKQVGIRSGGVWYNGWAGKWSENLKAGDTVEVVVEEVTKNGTTYRNIKPPKAAPAATAAPAADPGLTKAIEALTAAINNLADAVTANSVAPSAPLDEPPPEEEGEEEPETDVPF